MRICWDIIALPMVRIDLDIKPDMSEYFVLVSSPEFLKKGISCSPI